jgi:integral membrane protein
MTTPTQPTLDRETNAFRIVAYVEAVTYLVLLGAVVLKRVFDGPDLVRALGPIHGIAFLVYFVLVLRIREGQDWGLGATLWVLFVSALPFGGFWAARHLKEA